MVFSSQKTTKGQNWSLFLLTIQFCFTSWLLSFCQTLWTISASNVVATRSSGSSSRQQTWNMLIWMNCQHQKKSINPNCSECLHKCDGRSLCKFPFGTLPDCCVKWIKWDYGFNLVIQVSQSRRNFFCWIENVMCLTWHVRSVLKGRDSLWSIC